MFEDIEKKFKKTMKDLGMEWESKTDREKFKDLIKRENMADLDKPVYYVAECPSWENPDIGPTIIKFNSKKERSEWYESQGKEVEHMFGIKIEMPEDPVPNKDFED